MNERVRVLYGEEAEDRQFGRLHLTFQHEVWGEQQLTRTFRSRQFGRAFLTLVWDEYKNELELDDERFRSLTSQVEFMPLPEDVTPEENEHLWLMREFQVNDEYEASTILIFDGVTLPPPTPMETVTPQSDAPLAQVAA